MRSRQCARRIQSRTDDKKGHVVSVRDAGVDEEGADGHRTYPGVVKSREVCSKSVRPCNSKPRDVRVLVAIRLVVTYA